MLPQHINEKIRFEQQVVNCENYVIPFIEQGKEITAQTKVMDVGCGDGGVMLPFLKKGCKCVGVDLVEARIEIANNFLSEFVQKGQATIQMQNVYDEKFVVKYKNQFDLIILKDVIEHVPKQEEFIPHLKKFLKPNGQIFFGFPPWYMPFGGHQQILTSKLASKMPYYHILPKPIYRGFLKVMKEKQGNIDFMMETKDFGITIERFERIVKKSNMEVVEKQWFLFNPIYKYKFNLKPRKQNWLFGAVPFVRNFLTTCVYYTIQDKV
jgi:SAM-dependent methyltransferase